MKKSATSTKSRGRHRAHVANRIRHSREGGNPKAIDFSDIPQLTPEMFARAVVRRGLKTVAPKAQITLRLDRDVLDWYKKQGPGYQSRINALLRAYFREASKSNL